MPHFCHSTVHKSTIFLMPCDFCCQELHGSCHAFHFFLPKAKWLTRQYLPQLYKKPSYLHFIYDLLRTHTAFYYQVWLINAMVNARNVGAGVGLVMFSWLGLYVHKDRWEKVGDTLQPSQVWTRFICPCYHQYLYLWTLIVAYLKIEVNIQIMVSKLLIDHKHDQIGYILSFTCKNRFWQCQGWLQQQEKKTDHHHSSFYAVHRHHQARSSNSLHQVLPRVNHLSAP